MQIHTFRSHAWPCTCEIETYRNAQHKTDNGAGQCPPAAHEEHSKDGYDGEHKSHDPIPRIAGRPLDSGDHRGVARL